MRSIHIKASREYDVLVERGLLDRAGELLREVSAPGMAAIVSDDTVYALYGERTVKALEKAGYRVHSFTFPAGEGSKNLSTYADVLHFLGEHRFSRSDVVVALGGGVVGDLAGFAAATYQRGMGFAQIPTTLLAAVDSSVGGKTAVDLPTGKNQAGSFYQPCIVICDPNTLETLPEEQYRCGCAEIIKYSMLGNAAFFEELYKTPVREQYEHAIKKDAFATPGWEKYFRSERRIKKCSNISRSAPAPRRRPATKSPTAKPESSISTCAATLIEPQQMPALIAKQIPSVFFCITKSSFKT